MEKLLLNIETMLKVAYMYLRGSKYDVGDVVPFYNGFTVITKKQILNSTGNWVYSLASMNDETGEVYSRNSLTTFNENLITFYYNNPDKVLPKETNNIEVA